MEVTLVMDGAAPKLDGGMPVVRMPDGTEQKVDLGTLLDLPGKYGTLSKSLDELRPKAAKAAELEQKIAALGAYGDPAKLAELTTQLETANRELATHKTGKSDEELEAEVKRRMSLKEADHSTQLETITKARDAAEAQAKAKDEVIGQELVNSGIATAAALIPNFTKSPVAIAEQQELARRVWRFEEGKITPRGADGKILYGPDGVTFITYQQWLEGKTHLIGAGVNGGGSRGGSGTGGGDKTIARATFNALPATEQMQKIRDGIVPVD